MEVKVKTDESWWRSSTIKIYTSHSLSSWGDRMWSFALGIYLYYLYPQSLQLTAVYGFGSCISVILLGALIGKWIDKTARLKAAQLSLIVQNLSVILCAAMLASNFILDSDLEEILDGVVKILLIGLIIFIGIIADLASVATKIALQKDWIVVLSEGNADKLAKMNSTMRSIDLTTSILAPILVGQLLTYLGRIYSAAFIAGWNLISVFAEYYLLISIYKHTPQLEKKCVPKIEPPKQQTTPAIPVSSGKEKDLLDFDQMEEISLLSESNSETHICKVNDVTPQPRKVSLVASMKKKAADTWNGWKSYFQHPVRNAGVALALLYMTVLGFDNITRGYALSQGVSESYLGIATAFGAAFGILGSLSFPRLRKKLGKLTTGNIGFGTETCCLILCVVSIFTSGSPYVQDEDAKENLNSTISPSLNSTQDYPYSLKQLMDNNISIILLLTGIVTARFGLWIADLSVSQIFQENVIESQRGILNGVQGSLNQGMNLIKFILVIALPKPKTFAFLIGASWLCILLGWIFFITYTCKNSSASLSLDLQSVESDSSLRTKSSKK